MKNYTDLYIDSPKAFLRKLEEDIKAIEANLNRLQNLTVTSIGRLLEEYERLAVLVEDKAYGGPVLERWEWTAESNNSGVENLYAPEVAKGRWFRWTGPSTETRFTIPVRRDVAQTLRVSFGPGPGRNAVKAVATTRVLVDGQPQSVVLDGDDLRVNIPVRERQSALPTLLVLDTGQTVKPGNGDERELGIALFSLIIEPAQQEVQLRG